MIVLQGCQVLNPVARVQVGDFSVLIFYLLNFRMMDMAAHHVIVPVGDRDVRSRFFKIINEFNCLLYTVFSE